MSGVLEIVLIVLVVLLVFGVARLPAAGHALGRMVRNFRHAAASREEIEVSPVKERDEAGPVLPPGKGDPP